MKKIIFNILIFISINLYCEDITYIVTNDSFLSYPDMQGRIASVKKGDILYFSGRIRSNLDIYEILVNNNDGQEGFINSGHILLINSLKLPYSITDRLWIPCYYQQFLLGYPKETLFDFEPLWRDDYYEHTYGWGYSQDPWWWSAGMTHFIIKNNIIIIADLYVNDFIRFANISQNYENDTVILVALCEYKNNISPQNNLNKIFNIGNIYKLILKIDGDYIEIFLDETSEKIAALVGVDKYFQRSINNYFHGESVELSRIIWPRRADGTMDYPPPTGVDLLRTYERIFFTDAPIPYTTENYLASNKDARALPFWVCIVISVGIVVGVVLIIFLKKKKMNKLLIIDSIIMLVLLLAAIIIPYTIIYNFNYFFFLIIIFYYSIIKYIIVIIYLISFPIRWIYNNLGPYKEKMEKFVINKSNIIILCINIPLNILIFLLFSIFFLGMR